MTPVAWYASRNNCLTLKICRVLGNGLVTVSLESRVVFAYLLLLKIALTPQASILVCFFGYTSLISFEGGPSILRSRPRGAKWHHTANVQVVSVRLPGTCTTGKVHLGLHVEGRGCQGQIYASRTVFILACYRELGDDLVREIKQ
jgi:hypothetical protein